MCEESYISSTVAVGTADEVEFSQEQVQELSKGSDSRNGIYVFQFNALDGWMNEWMDG